MRRLVAGGALSLVILGCGGHKKAAGPPPVYERPTLPEWTPPESEQEDDPIANLSELEGEWVTDPDEESGEVEPPSMDSEEPGDEPEPSVDGNKVSPAPAADEASQEPPQPDESSELPAPSQPGKNGGK